MTETLAQTYDREGAETTAEIARAEQRNARPLSDTILQRMAETSSFELCAMSIVDARAALAALESKVRYQKLLDKGFCDRMAKIIPNQCRTYKDPGGRTWKFEHGPDGVTCEEME